MKNPGAGFAIGIAVGVAIGVATDNIALWTGIGGAMGAALFAVMKFRDGRGC